ncbi:MAG: AAA family ATPase [Candidatus Pacearchaeota archaeon]
MDRGFGDTLGYYLYHKIKIPKIFFKKSKKIRYEKIFFLDPLKIYKKDKIKKEEEKEAKEIAKCILKAYKILRYKIIKVPFISIKDRASFIEKRL